MEIPATKLSNTTTIEKSEKIVGVYIVEKAMEPEDIDISGEVPTERRQKIDPKLVANFDIVKGFREKYKHNNFNDLGRKVPRDETRN